MREIVIVYHFSPHIPLTFHTHSYIPPPHTHRPEGAVSARGWETVRGDLQQNNEEVHTHNMDPHTMG